MRKLLLLLLVIVFTGCGEETPSSESSVLFDYFNEISIPSAIMGCTTSDGKRSWYAFGPSVWDAKDTVSEHHIFRIASMTKAITAVAALQLVERELIGLDEPLDELMPEMHAIPILTESGELKSGTKPITLRHLLTHTSGFGYGFTSSKLANFNYEHWEYADSPRLFEAGTRWLYGTSTDWVGRIIEKVSGQDLETYFKTHITGPLKMDRTFFNVPDSLTQYIVSWGFRDSSGINETQRIPEQPVSSYSGGGGLFSSPDNYLTFLECLLNEGLGNGARILKSETVKMLFEDQLTDRQEMVWDIREGDVISLNGGFADPSDKFGLAWALENNENESIRSKGTGYWAGIGNTYYSIDKEKGKAVVYFTQFLPFNDQESFDFFRLFEMEVYQ